MENATKALIMVAGVLMGMMILALAAYLVISFGHSAAEVEDQNRENQLAQFNVQFTKYNGKTNLTIHDILSVADLADENNKNYDITTPPDSAGRESSFYVDVIASNIGGTRTMGLNDILKIRNDNNIMSNEIVDSTENIGGVSTQTKKLRQYKCNVSISNVTGRVYMVAFSKSQ